MELDLAELTHVKKKKDGRSRTRKRSGKGSGADGGRARKAILKKRKWVTEGKREMEEDESSECRRRQRGGKVEGRREGGGVVIGRRTIQQDGKNR